MQPSAPALYPFVSLLSKLDQYCSNGVVKILTKNHPKIHEKYQVLSQIWTLNTKCHKIMVGQSERKYRRFWIPNHIFENNCRSRDMTRFLHTTLGNFGQNISFVNEYLDNETIKNLCEPRGLNMYYIALRDFSKEKFLKVFKIYLWYTLKADWTIQKLFWKISIFRRCFVSSINQGQFRWTLIDRSVSISKTAQCYIIQWFDPTLYSFCLTSDQVWLILFKWLARKWFKTIQKRHENWSNLCQILTLKMTNRLKSDGMYRKGNLS